MREATLRWLEHEAKLASQSQDEREWYLVQLAESDEGVPEQPEPLNLLRKLRRFDLPLCSGGYLAQPHIALMEFTAVAHAELEHEAIQAANRALKAAAEKPNG